MSNSYSSSNSNSNSSSIEVLSTVDVVVVVYNDNNWYVYTALDFSASLTRIFVWSLHLLADALDFGDEFDGGAIRVIFAGAGQTVDEFRRSAGRVVVQRHRRR